MRDKHRPNSVGLTIHQYILRYKPRNVPLAIIAHFYNGAFTFEEADELLVERYGPEIKSGKIKAARRARRLGPQTVKNMMKKGAEDLAAELFDRGTPEARKWLLKYLPPAKRRDIEERLARGAESDPPTTGGDPDADFAKALREADKVEIVPLKKKA